jgi:hypothetical protein
MPMELKNCRRVGIAHVDLRDSPLFLRTLHVGNIPAGLSLGFSRTIFKKYESNLAGNITSAVKITIPGIGTGNPGSISSDFVKIWFSMILL